MPPPNVQANKKPLKPIPFPKIQDQPGNQLTVCFAAKQHER